MVQFRESSGLERVQFREGLVWRGFGLEGVPDWRGFGSERVPDWRGFGVLYVMNLIILPPLSPCLPSRSSKGTYNQYLLLEVRTYCQGWFMHMRYTQGQNEEYLLSRSMY